MAMSVARVRSASLDDPFAVHMAPPAGETSDQRTRRLAAAQHAEKTSRQIDEVLLAGKRLLDKKRQDVKILLLGQSESGKSTVLKNFRLRFTPQYFDGERAAWRTVVLLNLISSVRTIVDAIHAELAAPEFTLVSAVHRQRCDALVPLLAQEGAITALLAPISAVAPPGGEITVRPGGAWKVLLAESDAAKHTADVAAALCDEVETLWGDAAVRELLQKRDISLRDAGGYFLDDIARVTDPGYVPTDADILRARIKTLGVEEHFFEKEGAPGTRGVKDFWIYDVPGSRGSRAVWISFFDQVQAIVFLTPLSFYEVLEEDTRVNRLEDSVVLWKEVCANALLAHVQIILFFNKMDILKAKLRAGLIVKEYVPSFGDRENSYAGATAYFKEKFRAYHKRTSPKPRSFFYYETTAVDTRSTAKIIGAVHEEIFRKHLHESILI
ncbi:guanine nucleotide binding protein, alpha subunit [Mycena belliarum]|uniref:Guanine nucleotide binding protein, alpha subunit n=1 Tax=Mycena belliarum TaxID=1033014 RepID=A0AAD6UK61_9AGAR|nr:guanine nucleotide binding protein, alpha subunit [Mycena belliae]